MLEVESWKLDGKGRHRASLVFLFSFFGIFGGWGVLILLQERKGLD